MFTFEQFWEYSNQRIRYNESIHERKDISLSELRQHPPQQCALPTTPKLRPQLSRQNERRNVLRQYSSMAQLRLSKTKQRDYMSSLGKWAHKKYKKLTERKEYEMDSDLSDESAEWETDSDFDDIQETPTMGKFDSMLTPVDRQQRILNEAEQRPFAKPPLALNQHVVSEMMQGPLPSIKGDPSSTVTKRKKKKKKKKKEKKKKDKWKGDEKKRLKMCVGALMQMRFHDQLAYGGLLSSITLYMRTILGMSAPSAAMAISVWTGLCYLTPLLSAYFADARWGRGKTLLISQYIFFLGMSCIAISTYFGSDYYSITHGLFWAGMAIVGVGFGGFKPTLSPLGADQFDAKHKTEEQKKIAKEARSSFFAWLYWMNQLGAIVASSVIAYVCQNIDFSIGWSLACIALIFAIASYYGAKNYFIMVPPEGSIFGDFLKVSCISCRARCSGKEAPPPLPVPYTPTATPLRLRSAHSTPLPTSPLKMNVHKGVVFVDHNHDDDEQQTLLTVPLKAAASAPHPLPVPDYKSFGDSGIPSPINEDEEERRNQNENENDNGNDDDDGNGPRTPPLRPPKLSMQQSSAFYSPGKPSMLDWNKRSNGGGFDDMFVEDIKSALSALPALIPFPVAYIIYTNLLTLVYSQGCQMNVQMGSNGFMFPISSLSLIGTITIIVFVPLTESVVYPAMNRYGGCLKVTPLRKMGSAFTLAIIAMLISGVTEIVRKSNLVRQFTVDEMSSPCGNGLPVSDLSILWQSPQFFLLGMSRVLINTGAQDFFYTESPKSMKSTLFSLNYAVDGVGAMMGSLSIMVVNSGDDPWITNNLNDGHLEYYFFSIGGIMIVLFGMFLVFAAGYTYKEFKRKKRGRRLRGK